VTLKEKTLQDTKKAHVEKENACMWTQGGLWKRERGQRQILGMAWDV